MSDFKVNSITDRSGYCGPVIAGVSTNASSGCMIIPKGPTEHRGGRGRAIFAGGYGNPSPGERDTMDFIEIATTGNAVDFGDLQISRYNTGGGVASATRGLFAGGRTEASPARNLTTIDYVTISSGSGGFDWGDLPTARQTHDGVSNNVRGLYGGGRGIYPGQSENNALGIATIEFLTIASTGALSTFGELSTKRMAVGGLNSAIRGLFCGGYSTPAITNVIDYVEIATTGNALDFGDVTDTGTYKACASNGTRGLITGNGAVGTGSNVIEFVTIATLGNGQDFGDLTVSRQSSGATSNITRGVFGGGGTPSRSNVIDFVTIASAGNAQDFGDLVQQRSSIKAVGDAHGGLVR
tara:strand:- start:257 stop:1315 length:1059 start_codon:yes stop_codon:yes gene_type:complete